MPKSQADLARQREVLAAYEQLKQDDPRIGSLRAAALLGVPASTLREWYRHREFRRSPDDILEMTAAPDPSEPIEALLERKRAGMRRAKAYEEWAKLIPVRVTDVGPIGLLLVGDPHVDDDHCDIERLESDLRIVGRTKAFYAGHVGDFTNNWVGRLAKLYANQSTTFADGVRLVEWMFSLCPSLFSINGNHDMWNQGSDLLRWIVNSGTHQSHGARMELIWPDQKSIRIHARHDFTGRSMYSSTHGHRRELREGHKDHILVAGHLHSDEAAVAPSVDKEAHWMFRVSGYKVIDEYAKEHGFKDMRLAPSTAVVIDPTQPVPADRVKPFWNPELAAEYLTWRRAKTKSR